ncbi:MAG TPA: prepilin-type N-terminal cleavage/methylation domain-containing protein [Verrucomicrobiota bacterium]|nr:prepilin-type N-terminal cleavage/methylation domain-containing protein [Verrucomicrobiota bacterium]HNT14291.1 prepilin-type N-terminal cleavage/methylation domain-containing protein [Verrucomicrobiota bacterium]
MLSAPRPTAPRPSRWRAFSLIEVMIALAIFFMCTFAILGLTSQLLQNARAFQTRKAPGVALVHAWYTSMTNRVTEGEFSGSLSDISEDLGKAYPDYEYAILAEPDPYLTNGLWNVTYRIFNRRTHQVESEVATFYWDPNTQSRTSVGVGGFRP